MSSPTVLSFDDATFEKEVLASEEPVLVDFTATWCGPCKALAPVVEKLAASSGGRFKVGKVDIDDAPETARRYGIRGAPTLVVFKGGKETARHIGVTTEKRLLELLAR